MDEKQLLSCADAAMYKAKKNGGNRIEMGYQGLRTVQVQSLPHLEVQLMDAKKMM